MGVVVVNDTSLLQPVSSMHNDCTIHSMLHSDWPYMLWCTVTALYTLWCTVTGCTCYDAQWLGVQAMMHSDWLYRLCCTMTAVHAMTHNDCCTCYVAQWLAVHTMLHNDSCKQYDTQWLYTLWCTVTTVHTMTHNAVHAMLQSSHLFYSFLVFLLQDIKADVVLLLGIVTQRDTHKAWDKKKQTAAVGTSLPFVPPALCSAIPEKKKLHN